MLLRRQPHFRRRGADIGLDLVLELGEIVLEHLHEVARGNADSLAGTLHTRIEYRTGDLLAPLAGDRVDVLVSNPPYIAFEEAATLPDSVRNWEPCHALLSGDHGLDATRRIIGDAPGILSTGGLLALEVDSRRARQVADLAAATGHFRDVDVFQDLTGRDRFVLGTRTA